MLTNMSENDTKRSYLLPEVHPTLPTAYFEYAVQGLSLTLMSILGLVANTICLIVMTRPALKKGQCSSVNALLTSMAAVDIIVLICR